MIKSVRTGILRVTVAVLGALVSPLVNAQHPGTRDLVYRPPAPGIAIPEFKCACPDFDIIETFNSTLSARVGQAGIVRLIPRTFFPLHIPQQPRDLHAIAANTTAGFQRSSDAADYGLVLTDWSSRPTGASYVMFGYAAVVEGNLIVRAWIFDLIHQTPAEGQLFTKTYIERAGEVGARSIARLLATDVVNSVQ